MLYGGGVPITWQFAFGAGISNGANYNLITPDPNASGIKMRTAPDPWGPWSQAYDVLKPSDPAIASRLCACAQPTCNGTICNPAGFPEIGPGVLYLPSVVDTWTTSGPGTATIGWYVSTWNPYQVDQMKPVTYGSFTELSEWTFIPAG